MRKFSQNKKARRKGWWILFGSLSGVAVILSGGLALALHKASDVSYQTSKQNTLSHHQVKKQIAPQITINPTPSIISANSIIAFSNNALAQVDDNQNIISTPIPPSFMQTITLNNPKHYDIKASYEFMQNNKVINATNNIMLSSSLLYSTNTLNNTLTFSVPFTSMLEAQKVMFQNSKNTFSLKVILDFYASNSMTDKTLYSINHTYTFLPISLNPSLLNTTNNEAYVWNISSSSLLPKDNAKLNLSSQIANVSNTDLVNAKYVGLTWQIVNKNIAGFPLIATNDNENTFTNANLQSGLTTWMKEYINSFSGGNGIGFVDFGIQAVYNYSINGIVYGFATNSMQNVVVYYNTFNQ